MGRSTAAGSTLAGSTGSETRFQPGTRGTSPGEAAEAPAAKVTGAAEGAALSAWGRTGSVGGGGIWAGGGRAETLGSCGGEAIEPRKAGPGSAAAAARTRGARGGL